MSAAQDARQRGEDAAKAAASWTTDGNSDIAERARVLGMLRDGDPAAEQYLPREPDLSGEFADDLTPAKLAREILGDEYDEIAEGGGILDVLADAFEEGVRETFLLACESELIKFCETGDEAK